MRRHQETWPTVQQGETQPNESVQVYIRSRPLLERETAIGCYSLLAVQAPHTAHVTHPTMRCAGGRFSTKTYQADGVFAEDTTSEEVYHAMNLPTLVRNCVQEPGSSISIIAYGQTGSGKTYSTTAIEGEFIIAHNAHGLTGEEFAVADLFSVGELSSEISLSIFELQGSACRDLLSSPPLAPITISTTASQKVSYGNLSTLSVHSKADMLEGIHKAKGLRLTRSTIKNDTSSR